MTYCDYQSTYCVYIKTPHRNNIFVNDNINYYYKNNKSTIFHNISIGILWYLPNVDTGEIHELGYPDKATSILIVTSSIRSPRLDTVRALNHASDSLV